MTIDLLIETVRALPPGTRLEFDIGRTDDGTEPWLRGMFKDADGNLCSAAGCPASASNSDILIMLETLLRGGAKSKAQREELDAMRKRARKGMR